MQSAIGLIFKTRLLVLLAFLIMLLLVSCAKGITPYQAASGKAKCGRYIK